VEDSRRATVGFHYDCPNRRYVGGTSVYVCECKARPPEDYEPWEDWAEKHLFSDEELT
jgi:hypothetical protein